MSGDGEYPGGGGLYIEFPFCLPDNFPNEVSSSNSKNIHSRYVYTVDSCSFTNNIARKLIKHYSNDSISLFPCAEETSGRGGGMSIFIRGNATYNTIVIINTNFPINTTEWGTGLLI